MEKIVSAIIKLQNPITGLYKEPFVLNSSLNQVNKNVIWENNI